MSRNRGTAALSVASLVSGLLAYVVFAATTRALGPVDAAPVSVLWSYWSLAAAAITFPLQHWITQSVVSHGGFAGARRALPRVLGVATAATVATGAIAWLLRDALFGRDDLAFPLLVAALTAGSALLGLVRGGLTSRRQFGALAVGMLAENGARCVGVVALMLTGVDSPVAFGACIAAGHLTGLLWPGALRFSATGTADGEGSTLGQLSGASAGQLLAQLVLTGGPVVLALNGGSPVQITALFAGLAIYRAPYIVALGLVAQVTGHFTQLVVQGRSRELNRIRLVLALGTVAAAAVAAGLGAWVGPAVIRLVFGADVSLDASASAVLAVGSVLAVANLVISTMVIARRGSVAAGLAWVLGMAVAAPLLAADTDALLRLGMAFAAAEAVAFAVMTQATRARAA